MMVADVWHSHHWIDFRDWLGALAPAVAATVALVAVLRARRETRESAARSLHQRRVEFQLSALRQLSEKLSEFLYQEQPQGRNGEVEALIALSGMELPVTSWTLSNNMMQVPPAVGAALEQEQNRIRHIEGEEVRNFPLAYSTALREVVAAIHTLLKSQPGYQGSITSRFWRRIPQA